MYAIRSYYELSKNIVHLVLARHPDGPPGVKGISLFLVPKYLPDGERNDVSLVGINHKMGYRGTVNTVLNFGENGRCVAYLIGEPRTSGRGVTPRPGRAGAAMRPCRRCGAPSARLTVT